MPRKGKVAKDQPCFGKYDASPKCQKCPQLWGCPYKTRFGTKEGSGTK